MISNIKKISPIHQLLADLGKHHPQALVYSLTVACKSNNSARRNAANKILNKIREHSETLVNQAMMMSDELIRVAILWHEQWHEALEEASRLYFGERNIQGMLAKLQPLHALLGTVSYTVGLQKCLVTCLCMRQNYLRWGRSSYPLTLTMPISNNFQFN